MRKLFRKAFVYFVLVFLVLFSLRFIYGFISYPNNRSVNNNTRFINSFDFKGKNYATKKMSATKSSGTQSVGRSVDQKYEKVASLGASTDTFTEDEQKIRQSIKDFEALIQFEQSSGLPGARYLNLAIGVNPEKFDTMTEMLQKIGMLQNIRIDKTDKTSEYKDLQAQKEALEKMLSNLLSIKKQGGKIDELMQLEAKILEIEKEIQNLGLSLGEFDEENEFCTIKYSLQEVRKISTSIPISQRLKVAFEWTIRTYFYLLGALLFACGIVLCISFIGRLLAPIIERFWNKKGF